MTVGFIILSIHVSKVAGQTFTPSCVSFSENTKELLVGSLASRKKTSNYKNTVFGENF